MDSIIANVWRLRRLGRVEAGIFAWRLYGILKKRASSEASAYTKNETDLLIEEMREDEIVSDKEKHEKALRKTQKANELQAKTGTIGLAFIEDASGTIAFSKPSRYETALVRNLYRALHELQRFQAARAGKPVLPPVAVDVDVSGGSGETA